MTEEKKSERITTLFLSLGRIRTWDAKEYRRYVPITQEMLDAGEIDQGYIEERAFTFGGKSLRNANKHMGGSAGIVYAVEQPADNPDSLFIATALWHATWPDQDQRAIWQMADQTAGQQIALDKKGKKAKSDDALMECLEPVREAYHNARGLQRNLILARMVQYVTKR